MFRFINKKKNKSPASTPPPIRQRYKILFSASFKLVFLFFYDIIILFDNFFHYKKSSENSMEVLINPLRSNDSSL